jgi:hypothetical protein
VVLALRAHAVAIAGGGNVCAVVDPYNRVRVFDISERSASETETKQFPGLMSDHITVIALTTDGEGIAVGTAKGKVIVSINGSFTKLAGQSGAVSVLSWIGNDQWLLATDDDGSIRWLDFLSGKPGTICPTFSPVRSVAVNADGTNIVAVADLPIRNTALLLKTGLGAPLRLACEEPVISAAAFSADEAHVVVCAQAMHFFSAESGVVSPSIYEADRTLSSLKMFEFLAKNAIQLAISPSGEYIALATQEGHVKLWQRSPLCSFGILGRGVVGSKKLVFTSDERYLVAATPICKPTIHLLAKSSNHIPGGV